MTKRGKVLPARRPRERFASEESILLRSAETIGRVIGTLQRQLDGARGRLSTFVADSELTHSNNGSRPARKAKQKPPRKNAAAPKSKHASRTATAKRAKKAAAPKTRKAVKK